MSTPFPRRFHRFALVGATLLLFASASLRAQDRSPAPAPAATPAPALAGTPTMSIPAGAMAVPGQKFDPAVATRAWLDSMPAEKRANSDAYFEGTYWLLLWNFLLGAALSLLVLHTRVSARLRDFAQGITRFKAVHVILYMIPFQLILAALSFPLNVYQNFFRQQHAVTD